jgi:polyhydroxybutyrate depolymerase
MTKSTMTPLFLSLLFSFLSFSVGAKSVKLPALEKMRTEVKVELPKGFNKREKWPLIISLHGFGGSARLQNYYIRLGAYNSKLGFVYAAPNGLEDSEGKRYWNASNFCCDFDKSGVDDVGYIKGLIQQIAKSSEIGRIDLSRVYLVGYSNGAFLASKIACSDRVDIAGIATVSGTSDLRDDNASLLPFDKSQCSHNRPIAAVHIHGTEDETILYEGKDDTDKGSASALSQVSRWADQNGCTGELVQVGTDINATNLVRGDETDHFSVEGCLSPVEHYRINGGGHTGILKRKFTKRIINFLLGS